MTAPTFILGISAYHGDASAVLIGDGQLIAAVEEERFNRIKHAAGFPSSAIRACLDIAGIKGSAVAHVAVSRRPWAHIWRKAMFALRHRPDRRLMADRSANYRRLQHLGPQVWNALSLADRDPRPLVHAVEHHPAHLASTFLVSPYDEAAVCAIDGFGDFVSTSWGMGRGATLTIDGHIYFPHSLGLLYLAVTQYLGFLHYGDEFKVMGLAPYGTPDLIPQVRQLIRLQPRGRFALDLSYFQHWTGRTPMTWAAGTPEIGRVFSDRLEREWGPARAPDAPLSTMHEALAASLQAVFEEALWHVLGGVHRRTRQRRLCLAGGCAMNSVANGKIRANTPFTDVFIQPAAGDNGTALGAAYWLWHQRLGRPRAFAMDHSLWGPEFSDASIAASIHSHQVRLDTTSCRVTRRVDLAALTEWTAQRLANGDVIGWFQGRMEWGARALGNRSILADPRRADMREVINTRIKFRERFRPFAPSIVEEAAHAYFVDARLDPFMMQVAPVRPDKRAVVPAITHVDGSGRVQTVSRRTQPRFWELLTAFGRITGVPMLLNTSFNENEPIVHTPDEALDCFLRTGMDALVLGDYTIEKPSRGAQ